MSDREKTEIPTRMCIVQDKDRKLHFRFNKDPVIHDDGEEVVMEMVLDFSKPDYIVENAFRLAFEMDTLGDHGTAPMEQMLEFIFECGYHAGFEAGRMTPRK